MFSNSRQRIFRSFGGGFAVLRGSGVFAAHGRCPGGSVLSGRGEVDGGVEKGKARAARGRLRRPGVDKGKFYLPGKGRRERLPVREGEPADRTSPRGFHRYSLVSQRPLERPAAALPRLVDREGRHGERAEHVAQMVVAVSAVALETVHVPGLQSLERLVFHRPPAAGAARDRPHRAPVKPLVGDPGECRRLSPCFHGPGHVRLEIEVLVVGRQFTVPLEPPGCAGLHVAPHPRLSCVAGLEPAERKLAVPGLAPSMKRKPFSVNVPARGPFDARPSSATIAFMCGCLLRGSPTGRFEAFLSQSFLAAAASLRTGSGPGSGTSLGSGWMIAAPSVR